MNSQQQQQQQTFNFLEDQFLSIGDVNVLSPFLSSFDKHSYLENMGKQSEETKTADVCGHHSLAQQLPQLPTTSNAMNGDLNKDFAALIPDMDSPLTDMIINSDSWPTDKTKEAQNVASLFDCQYLFSPSTSTTTLFTEDCTLDKCNSKNLSAKKPPPPPLQISIPTHNLPPAKSLSQLTTTQKGKKTYEEEEEDEDSVSGIPEGGCRKWRTTFVAPQYQNSLQISVTSKTRCEEPSEEMPDKLYSSLKYEIRQSAIGSTCSAVPFLLGRITVVDAVDFHTIQKDKKSVLKGVVEGSLVKPAASADSKSSGQLDGVLKVQFTDVSYHHKKRGFCFQISYFVPSDLINPILIKRSAPFLVYARKPSQGKKRRRVDSGMSKEETDTTLHDPMQSFTSKLEDLVQCSKKLRSEDRKSVMNLMLSKLREIDPETFSSKFRAFTGNTNITN